MRAIDDMSSFVWGNSLSQYLRGIPRDEESWLAVQKELSVGDMVTGRIVGCAVFGVWLDIGVGYPALLEITEIREPGYTYSAYCKGEWGQIGTEVTARIVQFRDDPSKQIRLVQDRPKGSAE